MWILTELFCQSVVLFVIERIFVWVGFKFQPSRSEQIGSHAGCSFSPSYTALIPKKNETAVCGCWKIKKEISSILGVKKIVQRMKERKSCNKSAERKQFQNRDKNILNCIITGKYILLVRLCGKKKLSFLYKETSF